jgi:hypothetical protein
VRWFQRRASAEKASRGPVYLASSPRGAVVSGRYFDGKEERRLPDGVLDVELQDRVWKLGDRLERRSWTPVTVSRAS